MIVVASNQVDDTDIDVRVWPRASATAERLWSDATLRDLDAAEERIEHQRCRMVQRGIRCVLMSVPVTKCVAAYRHCQACY